MTSNLTPEQRMDKNGRMVTRHVLASHQAPSGISMVPAPSLSGPVKQRTPQRDDMLSRLDRLESESFHQSLYAGIKEHAVGLDDADLNNLVILLEHDKDLYWAVTGEVYDRLKKISGTQRSQWLRRMKDNHLRRWEDYCVEVKRIQRENYAEPSRSSVALKTLSMVDGLEHYEAFGLELTPDQENNLIALTSQLYLESIFRPEMLSLLSSEDMSGGEDELRINSVELIHHVIDKPSGFATVMDHVRNPAVTRPAELLHLLNNEGSSSLTSGVL